MFSAVPKAHAAEVNTRDRVQAEIFAYPHKGVPKSSGTGLRNPSSGRDHGTVGIFVL